MAATRSLNTSRKKKQSLPFYELPSSKTSAKIIAEARQSVRALPTNRPTTPADHRILFGNNSSHSRPPSAFSIGAHHFTDERLSRPGTGPILPPIGQNIAKDITKKSKEDLSVLVTPPLQSTCEPKQTPYQTGARHHSIISGLTESKGQASNVTLSMSTVGGFERELSSNHSGELELKQSQFSPVHSKRSLSADTLKRLLANHSESTGCEDQRVISAEETRNRRRREWKSEKSKPLSSSGKQDKKPSIVDLPFWELEISPLLSDLESTSYEDIEHLCESCSLLWLSLKRHNLIGRTGGVGGSKRRSVVLKTIFKLLDHKDPKLLLKVAKIIIAMQVTGKNLLNVCKLLFTLAKSESNDQLFEEESISAPLVEMLMLADPLSEQEIMVYGIGTLKLLSSCPNLREQLADCDVMVLMMNTLKVCCEAQSSVQLTVGEMTHLRNMLIQLTGALRCLSDSFSLREKFVTENIIPQLASVLSDHITSTDIVFNISRLFSKLTLNSDCLAAVLQYSNLLLPSLLKVLSIHSKHMDILLRVCFILGNMTSDDNETRYIFFFGHSPLSYINPLFQEYLHLEGEQIHGPDCDTDKTKMSAGRDIIKKQPNKPEDVLIKLIRVIANLSVHPEVGPRIVTDQDIVHSLLSVLANFTLSDYEELFLNTLATLNNLSYYAQAESWIVRRQLEIAEMLVNIMMEDSNDLLLESTRVCGNLSRYPDVRDLLVGCKVDEIMVTLLDSGHREMVYSACGVLINLLADSAFHENIARNGGIRKLVEVLHDFGRGDWQLASLVCKTLWNLSEKLTSSSSERLTSSVEYFEEEETAKLIQLLTNYTNGSFAVATLSSSLADPHQQQVVTSWQNNFLPVAQGLLARIKAYHSDLLALNKDQHHLEH